MSFSVEEDKYWEDDGDPVVHIASACWNEGKVDVRAGFGTNWGPDDPRNTEGTAEGVVKSELTAELTAVKNVLETHRMDRLIIRHKSKKLTEELRVWDETSHHDEHRIPNRALLGAIDKFMVDRQVWIEEVDPDEEEGLEIARHAAKRAAGMHSTSSDYLDNEFWSGGVRIVHIFGTATRSRDSRPRAGYGVYWGPGDAKNESGGVEGEQTHRRGQITAMYAAMNTAIENGLDELIIQSKCEEMHYLIHPRFFASRYCESETGNNQDLVKRVVELRSQFKQLHHILIRGDTRGQDEAGKLARLLRPIIRAEVVISGIQTTKGVVRYGVYFGEGDERNESGRVHGEQHLLIGELTAIKRAVIVALKLRIRFLTIRTASTRTVFFMNGEQRQWVQRQWMVNEETMFPCAEIGMEVVELMKKIKVRTVLCPDSEAFEAVALAETPQLNRHVPVYTSGTWHYCPLEKSVAGYGVFWKTDDEKNDAGLVSRPQNVIRARLTAVVRALEIAHQNDISRIVVRIGCEHTFKMVNESMWNSMKAWKKMHDFKYKDLMEEIDEEAAKLENVEYELCSSKEADCLSRCALDSSSNKSMTMFEFDF